MNDYCCQVVSISGRILETFHEDYLEAIKKATMMVHERQATQGLVFRYPDMKNPIGAARIIL